MTHMGCMGDVQHLLAQAVLCVLDGRGHMEIHTATQHKDSPHTHTGIPSLDGSTKVLKGSTLVLCT